jgi:hypothetical protein
MTEYHDHEKGSDGHSADRKIEDVHTVKKTHADGTVDEIDTHAIGGDVEEMPKGYYYSWQFIGTVIVSESAPTHAFITNRDIGNMSWKHLRVPGMGAASEHPVRCTALSPLVSQPNRPPAPSSTQISDPRLT